MRGNDNIHDTGVPLEGGPRAIPTMGDTGSMGRDDSEWLAMVRAANQDSREWFQREMQPRMRKAMDHFQSRHPAGSKFADPAYPRQRSSLFRPKSRNLANKSIATGANALFATSDVVQIAAANEDDIDSVEAAKFRRALLNYRLTRSLPWFTVASGFIADAEITGVFISHQAWRRDERKEYKINELGVLVEDTAIERDTPWVTPISPDDFGIHPQSNWIDPINSTPYIVWRKFEHIDDLLLAIEASKRSEKQQIEAARAQRMASGNGATDEDIVTYGIPYLDWTRETLERVSGNNQSGDEAGDRAKRSANRTDPAQQNNSSRKFGTVRVYRVIYRIDGVDWYFETINDQHMLSRPVPLSIAQRGWPRRPYVMGCQWIEPHSVYPQGSLGIICGLQEELNENVNQRIDNIRQQTNSRHLVRRGGATDMTALLRNVAGGIIITGDPGQDVKPLQSNQLNPVVYAEADRLSVEMDDLSGNFGGASVQTNRALNQTVGGMDLLGENANIMSEFKLRCLSESGLEPLFRQLDELICLFESDKMVISIALGAARVKLDPEVQEQIDKQFPDPAQQQPPQDPAQVAPAAPDPAIAKARAAAIKKAMREKALRLFRSQVHVSCSVGFGNTNPQKRMERITGAMNVVAATMPQMIAEFDPIELVKEVFGAAGYDNGARFFPALRGDEDPQVAMLKSQLAQAQQAVQAQQAKEEVRERIAQLNAQTQMQIAQIRSADAKQIAQAKLQLDARAAMLREKMADVDTKLRAATGDLDRQRLYMEREALSQSIMESQRAWDLQMRQINESQQAVIAGQQAELAKNLQTPGSGAVEDPFPGSVTPAMSTNAGVLARGNYGAIPGEAELGGGR